MRHRRAASKPLKPDLEIDLRHGFSALKGSPLKAHLARFLKAFSLKMAVINKPLEQHLKTTLGNQEGGLCNTPLYNYFGVGQRTWLRC